MSILFSFNKKIQEYEIKKKNIKFVIKKQKRVDLSKLHEILTVPYLFKI